MELRERKGEGERDRGEVSIARGVCALSCESVCKAAREAGRNEVRGRRRRGKRARQGNDEAVSRLQSDGRKRRLLH
jgi:hypothetical protein